MTTVTIDYAVDDDEVIAVFPSDPKRRVADMTDVYWGHRLLYDHARKLAERSEWPCPICGGELMVKDEHFNFWVHFHCPQCCISGPSAGSEESLRKAYDEWAAHIRSMIDMGREVGE